MGKFIIIKYPKQKQAMSIRVLKRAKMTRPTQRKRVSLSASSWCAFLPLIIVALSVLDVVLAFRSSTSSSSSSKSSSIPPPLPSTIAATSAALEIPQQETILNRNTPKVTRKTTAIKYDLGIGKHPPVLSLSSSSVVFKNKEENTEHDPTQFLREHVAVRDFPSPLLLHDPTATTETLLLITETRTEKTKKKFPKLRHVRQSQDIFYIHDSTTAAATTTDTRGEVVHRNGDGNTKHAATNSNNNDDDEDWECDYPIIARTIPRKTKFDLNTIWVEMLLHSEHKKHNPVYS